MKLQQVRCNQFLSSQMLYTKLNELRIKKNTLRCLTKINQDNPKGTKEMFDDKPRLKANSQKPFQTKKDTEAQPVQLGCKIRMLMGSGRLSILVSWK